MPKIIPFPAARMSEKAYKRLFKSLSLGYQVTQYQLEITSAIAEYDCLASDETTDLEDLALAHSKIMDLHEKEISFLMEFAERMIRNG